MGLVLHQPWLFPCLGAPVMLFFGSPGQKASRPLNALVGHGVVLITALVGGLNILLGTRPDRKEKSP